MKKLFSASLVLLLMFSTMSFTLSASNDSTAFDDSEECEDKAYVAMHQAINAGINVDDATFYMNAVYAFCEGYTIQDVEDAYTGPAGN